MGKNSLFTVLLSQIHACLVGKNQESNIRGKQAANLL